MTTTTLPTFIGNWTYSADPADSDLDLVRFLVGDTDELDKLASDEEILWALSAQPKQYLAAALVARAVAAKFAKEANSISVGGLSMSYSSRKDTFNSIADQLTNEAKLGAGAAGFEVYAGGISKADKLLINANTDVDQPSFRVGMHDRPGGSTA